MDIKKLWGNLKSKLGIGAKKSVHALIFNTTQPQCIVSPASLQLILDYEVGGGRKYYEQHLKNPCWPKGASGVTIGIGYDLGYNTFSSFSKDWGNLLAKSDFNRLAECLCVRGESAAGMVRSVKSIEIPWESAFDVFKQITIPRFVKETLRAFPKADKLHPDAFGALISLVFNRGSSVKGASRREMANIREHVLTKNYDAISNEILSMKRLWEGRGLDGLLKRRDAEAALVRRAIL